jgi:hypothetical protein
MKLKRNMKKLQPKKQIKPSALGCPKADGFESQQLPLVQVVQEQQP